MKRTNNSQVWCHHRLLSVRVWWPGRPRRLPSNRGGSTVEACNAEAETRISENRDPPAPAETTRRILPAREDVRSEVEKTITSLLLCRN